MTTKRSLIMSLAFIFVLSCSITLAPAQGGQPVATSRPTYTPNPTSLPSPTNTPLPSDTIEPSLPPPPLPTVELLPNAEKIEFGKSVYGNTMQGSKVWYFVGDQGMVVDVSMTGTAPYFFLHNQNNQSLIECDVTDFSNCLLVRFTLPYTGVYYIITEQRQTPPTSEPEWWDWWGDGSDSTPGGEFGLVINIRP